MIAPLDQHAAIGRQACQAVKSRVAPSSADGRTGVFGMHIAVRVELPLLASPRTHCDHDVQDKKFPE